MEVERTRGVKIVVEEEFQDAPPPGAALDAVTMPARADAAPTSPTGDAGSRIAVISLPARRSSRKTSAVVLAVAVVAFAAAALLAYRGSARRADFETGSSPPRSIAVLPFRNLTGDPAQEYFSDGLTESFITELSKIESLKVISRSSAFAFKEREADPRAVGESSAWWRCWREACAAAATPFGSTSGS